MLKTKIDMVDALLNIEVTSKLLQQGAQAGVDPVDAHYHQLHAHIDVVEADSAEYKLIQTYMANTHAATHSSYKLKIAHVFKVVRQGESERFQAYAKYVCEPCSRPTPRDAYAAGLTPKRGGRTGARADPQQTPQPPAPVARLALEQLWWHLVAGPSHSATGSARAGVHVWQGRLHRR